MNKVLHIIPDTHYIGNDRFQDKIDVIPIEERDNAWFWYLHGKLEEKLGFDKGIITNCKTLGISKPFQYDEDIAINKLYLNGVFDCEVEGIDEPCVGYFYVSEEKNNTNWMQRGLVCLKSDNRACQYAEKKMKEKSIVL